MNYGSSQPSMVAEQEPKVNMFIGAMGKELGRLDDGLRSLEACLDRYESVPKALSQGDEKAPSPHDYGSHLMAIEQRMCTLNNKLENLAGKLNSIF